MLLVKTKIGQSKIHGMGLFSDEFIAKGTPVWKFKENFDIQINPKDIDNLSEPAKQQFLNYGYQNPSNGNYILCFDDARFFNHHDNPNCVDLPDKPDGITLTVASRNILPGEELTCNYKNFDAAYGFKLKSEIK